MASKKISVLGSGLVGEVLANGFLKHGYEVLRASREPEKHGRIQVVLKLALELYRMGQNLEILLYL